MKFRYIFLILLLVITSALYFTNPDEASCRDFIKNKVITIFDEKLNQELDKIEDPNVKLFGKLSKNFIPVVQDRLVDEIIDKRFERKNFFLFSTLRVLYQNQWQTVGFGIFNKVYLFPQVEDELQKLDFKDEALKYFNN
ncbi:DUF4359 domain-containing protein [Apibacter sp. HY039]|uniref:DUF4359 domain-containing protein n=1 Tax=Apibacter sp. HY039 TaxID=2501476 RepID=UPI000FEB656C|nr:DUF4359 domain-containing protein [Apibacter sp. HY039]